MEAVHSDEESADKPLADEVMAVFGAALAREDDRHSAGDAALGVDEAPADPVEVFELTGVGATRSGLHVAATGGLAPLVGRDAERGRVEAILEEAGQGRGAAVALVGEAGVGKSRLTREWVQALRGA